MVRANSGPPKASPKLETVKLEVEDSLDDQYGPLHKKSRGLNLPHQQVAYQNVLDEPSPLGLRLRKSPSLLDLIQMRLAQGATTSSSCVTSLDVGKKELKSVAVSSASSDKLKASNFPVLLLRIGTWECVSRYEGDLVAKCYFAKHKLVWEVLEGGLKSKIEIQWSDITALKITCPEDSVGTLDVVLSRPPLFFRETDPQPRKHTLWQATQDFTKGQASLNRRHFLQCAQGLLSKNFEKLIQCDPRLYSLSQQPDIVLDSPYFEPQSSFEDEDSKDHTLGSINDNYVSKFSVFCESTSGAVTSVASKNGLPDYDRRASDFGLHDVPAPCSGIGAQGIEEKTRREAETRNHPNWLLDQLKVPGIRASMSVSDLVSHLEQHISEQLTSGNASFPSDAVPTKEILEDVAQYLLNDSQSNAVSDEKTLLTKVNSFCCLLQNNSGSSTMRNMKSTDKLQHVGETEDGSDSGDEKPFNLTSTISRKESYGELLNLPRIASLPQFLFNISEDDHYEAR